MFAPNNPYFNLSDKGKAEFGHIFRSGYVPIKHGHLIKEGCLEGSENDTDRVCCVDWGALDATQQTQILVYLSEKFSADPETIRTDIESRGYLPMRSIFFIEAYDWRFFV